MPGPHARLTKAGAPGTCRRGAPGRPRRAALVRTACSFSRAASQGSPRRSAGARLGTQWGWGAAQAPPFLSRSVPRAEQLGSARQTRSSPSRTRRAGGCAYGPACGRRPWPRPEWQLRENGVGGWEPLSAAAVSSAVAGLRSPRAEGKASGFDPARRGGGTSACAHGACATPRAPEVCSLILFLRENPRTSCGPRQIKIPKYSSCRLGNGISAPPGRAEPVPAATPSTPGDVLSVGEQAGAWPAGPPGGVRSRHLRRLPTGSLEGCVFCWICKPRACVWGLW